MEISLTTVRMFVHVLAATVWVGGQIVMFGLVPVARSVSPEAPRLLARRFGLISWSALVVLTFTGIWNAFEVDLLNANSTYQTTFVVKMVCYLLTALGAAAHSLGSTIGVRNPTLRAPLLAAGGMVGALGAFGALFFAVALKY